MRLFDQAPGLATMASPNFVRARLRPLTGLPPLVQRQGRALARWAGGIEMTESELVNELMEKVALRTWRDVLLLFIRARFPTAVTPDVERTIADQPSLALLRAWIAAAARAQTAEDFLPVLRR
jgi:hypothetical protein